MTMNQRTSRVTAILLTAAALAAAGAGHAAEPAEPLRIDHDVRIQASRQEVWNALISPDGLAAWIAPQSTVRVELGGPYELYFHPDDPVDRGMEGTRILSFIPLEMLSYEGEIRGSWIVWRLDDAGPDGVLLRFSGLGPARGEWKQRAPHFDQVMPELMSRLAKSLEAEPDGVSVQRKEGR
jgi:uncharacterized protein YndB with AHSA1/START domain